MFYHSYFVFGLSDFCGLYHTLTGVRHTEQKINSRRHDDRKIRHRGGESEKTKYFILPLNYGNEQRDLLFATPKRENLIIDCVNGHRLYEGC